jgi:hypothetical protein
LPVDVQGWLLFSAGGDAPWQEQRALGGLSIRLDRDGASVLRQYADDDVTERWSCEQLRSHFRLPSCPTSMVLSSDGSHAVFSSRGEGHGQGLDVAWAASHSDLAADEILRHAFTALRPSP